MLRKVFLTALLVLILFQTNGGTEGQENTATIHGVVYYWFTLEPMNGAIVEINTTPKQTMVASDGSYSFSVPPGDYTISASYYQDSTLIYYDEDNLNVVSGGDYRIDLILFPTLEENEIPENDVVPDIETGENNYLIAILFLFTIMVAIIVIGYYGVKRRPKKLEETYTPKIVGLPEDLKQVVDILKQHGGRMHQLDLKKQLPLSEAKISLMLADLESRGILRKIKRGRGNIIVLTELG